MTDEERQVIYQRASDHVAELRARVVASFPPVTPASHDDALALAPGDTQLDSVSGEVVEIVSGQRTHA
jgi:hypothetical protein